MMALAETITRPETQGMTIPRHVALIMDGNGRWARRKGMPVIMGHKAGADTAKKLAQKALDLGVQYLTLYTFSSENWQRPQAWIDELMGLLRHYLTHQVEELIESKIRIKIIGDRSRLPHDIVDLITQVEGRTQHYTKLTILLALSYGARDEMVQATKAIAQKVLAGEIACDEISLQTLEAHTYTAGIPDPDLLIRTSGEKRISNFLLWQLAYAELIFVDDLWPDFTPEKFEDALHEYSKRERRYGAYGNV